MSMRVGEKKFLPNEMTGVKVSDFCTELWKKKKAWMAFELKKELRNILHSSLPLDLDLQHTE